MFVRRMLPAVFLAVLCSCTPRYAVIRGYAQGGTYQVKYSTSGVKASSVAVAASVDSILLAVDNTLSGYNKGSLLSRINAGDTSARPDAMYLDILGKSLSVRDSTGGAFDAGAGLLFDIWGFGFTSGSLPSAQKVDSALSVVRSTPRYNFNAIAQGYTCDLVAERLKSLGVTDMLVDIGEIYCAGVNPSGRPWSVGVDNPVDGNDTPGADIRAVWESDGGPHGIVTSGNYRKFYVRDGRKYAHTIDPRTGYPVTHGLLSATVVAPTACEADALATAFMVAGPDFARDYTLSHDGIEAYLICADSVWRSPGFTLRQLH